MAAGLSDDSPSRWRQPLTAVSKRPAGINFAAWRYRKEAIRALAISATFLMLSALPLHSDTSLSHWFKSLMRNDGGGSCCDTADCRVVDYRTGPNGYEAFVDGQWTAIPNNIVLRRHDNPTGGAVLCREHLFRTMRCFVPGVQG
jgi:hypothetical protein